MKYWAKIEWEEEAYLAEEVEYISDDEFYAIFSAIVNGADLNDCELLYIGSAYSQGASTRIKQPHRAYRQIKTYLRANPDRDIFIITGNIVDHSQERMSLQFFNDIECCLIFCNKPLFNTLCKESYNGRPVEIINYGGYKPLKKKCLYGD
ncbi:hypothetical protein DRQ36_07865 [bacterium]|nr:MAG: hypothetical protein DRQ36_07865 [bacterium]